MTVLAASNPVAVLGYFVVVAILLAAMTYAAKIKVDREERDR